MYNSANGIVYLKKGSSTEEILSLITINDSGERIVDSYDVYNTKLPGRFDIPSFYESEIGFSLSIKKLATPGYNPNTGSINDVSIPFDFYKELLLNTDIVCFPRTNTI